MISPDDYIQTRLAQYQNWYDSKAVRMKALHLRLRSVSVIGGALVPALVNIDVPYINVVTTIVSLVVVILVSLESVFHYREQWKNYRSTEQLLGHERIYFMTRCGAYEGLNDQDAFRRLVERVESAIAAENASTLTTMTLAGQVTDDHLRATP
ncbi:DUF4231 domain-containing protein [Saccharomonospora azurea]|uniref:DUF4231 domain-containing protein n=1 Tax=Saccharomonospora azurea TaxID=40988 RepID=UPI003325D900